LKGREDGKAETTACVKCCVCEFFVDLGAREEAVAGLFDALDTISWCTAFSRVKTYMGPIKPKRSAIAHASSISEASHSDVPQYSVLPVLMRKLKARTVSSIGVWRSGRCA
jgi:hypothetical protein